MSFRVNRGALLAFGGVAVLASFGCGGEDERGPESQSQKPSAAPRAVIGSVTISPPIATKAVNLKARVEMSGAPGSDGGHLVFEWLRNGRPIEGEKGSILEATSFTKGDEIAVRVAPGGGGRAVESASVRIKNSLPRIASAVIVPETATREKEIEARAQAMDADGDAVSFRFQWMRNGVDLPGATNERLSLAEMAKGDKIGVRVTPHDGEEEGSPNFPREVIVRNANPSIVSASPETFGGGVFSYQVRVKDADNDPISFALAKAPAGMTIDKSGMIAWPISEGVAGSHEVEVVAADPDGGKATQAFTVTISVAEKK